MHIVLCAKSCPTVCDSMDCSPPGSSVHGILQARTLEWDAMPFSYAHYLYINMYYTLHTINVYYIYYLYIVMHIVYIYFKCVLVFKSCPTVCDSMDCSPPGSSVHGILQAKALEWVAISFSIYIFCIHTKPHMYHISAYFAVIETIQM